MKNDISSIELLLQEVDPIQDNIDDIILQLIKERKRKKITQIELSKMTNIPQATISRLESFNGTPTLPILMKIVQALGFTLVLSREKIL